MVHTEDEDDRPALWEVGVMMAHFSLAHLGCQPGSVMGRVLVVGDEKEADDREEVLCWRVATPPSTFAT